MDVIATSLAAAAVARTPSLSDLLEEVRQDSAEFPVALANHLPMVLVILQRLGATDARLRDYAVAYRKANGLVPPPPRKGPIAPVAWTEHLGDRSRESDYRAFFAREVAARGAGDAIRHYLPAMLPGIAGSALHPLMRLASGILRDDPAEIGTALGYWASCFLPLPAATGAPPNTDDPGEVLARVAGLPALRAMPSFDHLWYGMRWVGAEASFAPAVDWLRIGPDTLARVAATSLALFAATGDFAALHAVTGTHWVRLVSSVCPDPLLIRHFWQAVATLVPAIGFPALPTADQLQAWRALPCPDWPEIAAAAVKSDDEHDLSLVFSAREEHAIYGDRLYQVVAARRVGLIPA